VYLVATDDGRDPAYAAARAAGLQLARATGSRVVPYDRSSESFWTDPYDPNFRSPSVGGRGQLLGPEALRPLGYGYLADQLEQARAMGLDAEAALAWGVGPAAMVRSCQPGRCDPRDLAGHVGAAVASGSLGSARGGRFSRQAGRARDRAGRSGRGAAETAGIGQRHPAEGRWSWSVTPEVLSCWVGMAGAGRGVPVSFGNALGGSAQGRASTGRTALAGRRRTGRGQALPGLLAVTRLP